MAYITDENGNYRRTVTCGHCYEKGHNQSSCPKRRERLQRNIEENETLLAADNFDYEWRKNQAESSLRHSKQTLEKLLSKGKNRKCGFCSDEGHTRRTCQQRKDDVEVALDKALRFREQFCDKLIEAGIGPGALVEIDASDFAELPRGQSSNVLGVVTSVDFSELWESHKFDGTRWHSNFPRNIHITLVKPVKSTWSSSLIEKVTEMPTVQLLNVDDFEIPDDYRKSGRGLKNVASPVKCDRSMMSFGSTDRKEVSKWVLENIIDPK